MTKKAAKKEQDDITEEVEIEESIPEEDGDDDSDIELEIVDDTPEEDRGRQRRASGADPDIPDEDEIAQYSEGVQKRIKQLKWEFHEERRSKDEALRLQNEAIRFAQQQNEELQRLKRVLSDGEKALAENSKGKAEAELVAAREKYRKAYEDGDSEVAAQAMEDIARITGDLQRWSNYLPQYQVSEDQITQPPPSMPQAPRRPSDPKAIEWTRRNTWFGTNQPMTGFAMGLHQQLVRNGVHPQSDEYYEHIDAEMRRVFPNEFDGKSGGQSDPSKERRRSTPHQTSTVVAPVTRTPKTSRKVQLTATQVSLARRLGLTPEQYAEQVILESEQNG